MRGWAVAEQVASPRQVSALVELAHELAGVVLDEPETWDVPAAALATWAHQAQWDIRQSPRLHALFAELWRSEALVVSQDGLGYKPPVDAVPDARADSESLISAHGLALHWDLDPREARHLYQGVLYLTDVGPEDGPFCGVPGLFADLAGWLGRHPDAQTNGDELLDLEGHPVVEVCGRAGDLVLFDSRLPHGNRTNHGKRPRLVQYVSMFPAGFWGERRQDHAELYRTGMANPAYRWKVGWDEPAPWPPAKLTPLSRKLAGLDPW